MRQTLDTPKAMLIDLDDTIIYFPGVDACWCQVCADTADRVPGLDADNLCHEITRTRDWYWSDPERHRIGRLDLNAASISIVRRSLRRLGFDLPNLARDLGMSYRAKRDGEVEMVPGAVEALRRFRSQGIGLAMITNGTGAGQRGKIERFDLARHFNHIFIEGEIGLGKPEREVYLMAMAALLGLTLPRRGVWATTWSGKLRRRTGWASTASGSTRRAMARQPTQVSRPTASCPQSPSLGSE